jgi:hypothetical protein
VNEDDVGEEEEDEEEDEGDDDDDWEKDEVGEVEAETEDRDDVDEVDGEEEGERDCLRVDCREDAVGGGAGGGDTTTMALDWTTLLAGCGVGEGDEADETVESGEPERRRGCCRRVVRDAGGERGERIEDEEEVNEETEETVPGETAAMEDAFDLERLCLFAGCVVAAADRLASVDSVWTSGWRRG